MDYVLLYYIMCFFVSMVPRIIRSELLDGRTGETSRGPNRPVRSTTATIACPRRSRSNGGLTAAQIDSRSVVVEEWF